MYKIRKLFDKKLIKLTKIEKSKHSCITLFDKTERLAKLENKIPVVALCQKHRKGFWIVVKEKDLKKVIDIKRGRATPYTLPQDQHKANFSRGN